MPKMGDSGHTLDVLIKEDGAKKEGGAWWVDSVRDQLDTMLQMPPRIKSN